MASRRGGERRWPSRVAGLAAVVLATAACASPAPSGPTLRSAAPPTPVRGADQTPRPTPAPTASTASSGAPATDAPVVKAIEVRLHNAGGRDVLTLTVQDRSGHLVEATPGDEHGAMPESEDRDALEIGPGRSQDAIRVQLVASPCDLDATLDIAPDGRTLDAGYPPREACDAIAVGLLVELRFDGPVDPASFTGREHRAPLLRDVDAALVRPTAVAFVDASHGWIGATAPDGRAVVLETTDGGATWTVSVLAYGSVATVSPFGDGAIAGTRCAEGEPACGAGTWTEAKGSWFESGPDHLASVGVDGDTGIGLFEVDGVRADDGSPGGAIRTTSDGGLTWTDRALPCRDATSVGVGPSGEGLTLCTGGGAGGGSQKQLYGSRGADPWVQVASNDQPGSLPYMGAPVHASLAADGTGLLWGPRVAIMGTSDGGRTWSDVGLTGPDADGGPRTGVDGRTTTSGVQAVLMDDSRRRATILYLLTDGGHTWDERASWPD